MANEKTALKRMEKTIVFSNDEKHLYDWLVWHERAPRFTKMSAAIKQQLQKAYVADTEYQQITSK